MSEPREPLLRIQIDHEDGRFFVTPVYRHRRGYVVTIPDDKGWDTEEQAQAEARRIQIAHAPWMKAPVPVIQRP